MGLQGLGLSAKSLGLRGFLQDTQDNINNGTPLLQHVSVVLGTPRTPMVGHPEGLRVQGSGFRVELGFKGQGIELRALVFIGSTSFPKPLAWSPSTKQVKTLFWKGWAPHGEPLRIPRVFGSQTPTLSPVNPQPRNPHPKFLNPETCWSFLQWTVGHKGTLIPQQASPMAGNSKELSVPKP